MSHVTDSKEHKRITEVIETSTNTSKIREIIAGEEMEHKDIGWGNILYGRFSKKWQEDQGQHNWRLNQLDPDLQVTPISSLINNYGQYD